MPTSTASPPLHALRPASLLDVPLLFDLMLEGAEQGAFADRFLRRTGSVHLLRYLLTQLLKHRLHTVRNWLPHRTDAPQAPEWQMILPADPARPTVEPIGFLRLRHDATTGMKVLVLYAIAPPHRGQGHGTAVLRSLVAAQPSGTVLLVHCTKYARAMQHLLKKLRFARNPRAPGVLGLEEYRLVV